MVRSRPVLVLNTGSSSIKYALYNFGKTVACVFQGIVEGIGTPKSSVRHRNLQVEKDVKLQDLLIEDHKAGLKKLVELSNLGEGPSAKLYAVGHRCVHGGTAIKEPALITDEVKSAIERFSSLAPLHNPPTLQGITVAQELFHCPQVAVFDTAFHTTLPPQAYMYALPYKLYEELGIRRYGFHGTSYLFLLTRASELLKKPKEELNIIFFHLGAGASMAVVKQGICIDTTMGVTPLEGLVMATRCGDVDPAVVEILETETGMKTADVSRMMNKESGLYGLCGDKDMRTIIQAAKDGSKRHGLALQVFVHRIRKYLGAYLVELGGEVDALVFSAGIGEASGYIRGMVCEGLERFGIQIDEQENKDGKIGVKEIQSKSSKIKVLVIPTDEELSIAQQTVEVVDSQ
ncbi:hypothetical protein R1sor_003540 [Riccia sorocarpa]|uniref:Probable acetate kinase n=1 Tax=Riccia sorocarpa TaxID=122646 RepID=A0ABD3H1W4_9MARC